MINLREAIACCCCNNSVFRCKVKDKLDCPGNIDGDIYISDINEGIEKWLSSFDIESSTKCFEAIQLLKEDIYGINRERKEVHN